MSEWAILATTGLLPTVHTYYDAQHPYKGRFFNTDNAFTIARYLAIYCWKTQMQTKVFPDFSVGCVTPLEHLKLDYLKRF